MPQKEEKVAFKGAGMVRTGEQECIQSATHMSKALKTAERYYGMNTRETSSTIINN